MKERFFYGDKMKPIFTLAGETDSNVSGSSNGHKVIVVCVVFQFEILACKLNVVLAVARDLPKRLWFNNITYTQLSAYA